MRHASYLTSTKASSVNQKEKNSTNIFNKCAANGAVFDRYQCSLRLLGCYPAQDWYSAYGSSDRCYPKHLFTQIELLCWKTTKSVEQKVQNLITDSTVLLITPDVITHCVRIRRDKKSRCLMQSLQLLHWRTTWF